MDSQLAIGVTLTGIGTVLMLISWSKYRNIGRDRLHRGLRGYLSGTGVDRQVR